MKYLILLIIFCVFLTITKCYQFNQFTRIDYQPSPSNNQRKEASTSDYVTECPLNGTGQFPYLMDCRQFLICWKGRGYIQSCTPGSLFNPATSVCDVPSNVICRSFDSPERFDILSNTQETDIPEVLNLQKNTKSTVKCKENVSGLFKHPHDCRKFLNCANGATYIQSCGKGTVFNPAYNICDWPQNVECGAKLVEDISTAQSKSKSDDDEELFEIVNGKYSHFSPQQNKVHSKANLENSYTFAF